MISTLGRHYCVKQYDDAIITKLMQKYGLREIQARLISTRVPLEEVDSFLNPKIKYLMQDPSTIRNLDHSVDVLLEVLKKRQKILIWGDYDVDGICSVSLLLNYFRIVNAEADSTQPDRFKDGYGVNLQALKNLKNLEEYDLFIIVDCGSNDIDSIKFLKTLNKKIIIIDHHIILDESHSLKELISNKHSADKSGTTNLCAAAMVFMFIVGLNRKIAQLFPSSAKIQLMDFIDLVCLATICDIVPLTGLNRAFVKSGIEIINNTKNAGLKTLLNKLGIKKATPQDIGFLVGPCLNAAGRIASSKIVVELLSNANSLDPEEINHLVEVIVDNNIKRKAMCSVLLTKAIEQATKKLHNNILLLWDYDWHEGIIGIIASKIKDMFNKPCCIVSFNKNSEIGKGSGRSIDNFDLGDAILKANNLLIHGGGHKKAVGFSVALKQIEALDKFLQETSAAIIEHQIFLLDSSISLDAVSVDLYNDLCLLEPFGEQNPEPIFQVEHIYIHNVRMSGEKHISCQLVSEVGTIRDGVLFNACGTDLGDFIQSINENKLYTIIGRLLKQSWTNKIKFIIQDIINNE